MEQNQKSHATKYNRYPEIFKEISYIIPNPKQILSFGCSTGSECNTLHELYFNNSKIIGLDISKEIINKNKIKNTIKNIEYIDNIKEITKKSDLIFAMSVLCIWSESHGEYSFELFKNTLNIIDELLENNGYLCIYNSKYLFTDTELFKEKYEKIETNYKETGFVYKYDSNNKRLNYEYPYFLFTPFNISNADYL